MDERRAVVPVVLAAGASRRMGQPKALLDFDGACALELILATCSRAGLGTPVVVVGPERDRIAARVDLSLARVVTNPARERGQTSSVQVGLRALPDDAGAFLLWPVDHPVVADADVIALAECWATRAARGAGGPAIVALSCQGRRGHPILLSRALIPEILALPDDAGEGSETVRDVIRRNQARSFYVPTEDEAVLCDLDTPEDYHRMLAYHRSRAGRRHPSPG